MALIKSVRGVEPQFGDNCWLADNATVVGDVRMGRDCTVWFNAVVRGDVNSITFGNRCNVQDGAVVHCTYQRTKTTIGNNVSIAHNAIVHGCTIEDDVLIGMGAIIMDGAVIGTRSIIAAGAIITQNTIVPPGSIYAGNPARFLKAVSDEQGEVFMRTANNYVMYADWFK
ncbi:carbonic anhydrase/acetyltransferase-like protein (isoleucine patch superfamily) [Spirosoma oryzae]|uniref:Carbonic anhydrase/acetyltransferase-like protein (Isoleucine patch superfamily) n=1 Tax=Spirosoma oryzae TaxID=1469603 RepID=A0A2T0T8C5_9BACT|nr:gamma carbonic anhydrase family protein [Spirosoma oryzae]PRY41906.1 carbonic anhydrase/acetyltransferase-like protein (isoleucine patch superfamily) [Spirosoma oryzae]